MALFNLTIDSKLRGWDLVKIRVVDTTHGGSITKRAMLVQQKAVQPVQFEITEQAREPISDWVSEAGFNGDDYLFPSRLKRSSHMSTRQYARILEEWILAIGLDPADYGTYSLRRTMPTLIYRRTKNLRAVQILLAHTKLEITARYLGRVDDALEMAEQTEI